MINVVPNNDEREHIEDIHCWCAPRVVHETTERVLADCGIHKGVDYDAADEIEGPILLHNAADCREVCEELTGQPLAEDKHWTILA